MAGRDVRLDQQVKQTISPTVEDRTRDVKPINFGGAIDKVNDRLTVFQKAQQKADKTRVTDTATRLQSEYFRSQAKVASAKKLQALDVSDKETERLDLLESKALAELPDYLRSSLKREMVNRRKPLKKFQVRHTIKEHD